MTATLTLRRWRDPAVWRWRLLVLEALANLIFAFMKVHVVSFNRLAPSLGTVARADQVPEVKGDPPPDPDVKLARRVAAAVCRAACIVPKAGKCLSEAMAAKSMLSRRGIRTTLHLGAMPGTDTAPLTAHAWLTLGSIDLIGGDARAGHVELAKFG